MGIIEEVKVREDRADSDYSSCSFNVEDLQEGQPTMVLWSAVEEANADGVSR